MQSMGSERIHRLRYPLMALALLTVLAAMWGGLLRLGWRWPVLQATLPVSHGALMVSGVLGTVIGLERAVALSAAFNASSRNRWSYIAPLLNALGALSLILGLPGVIGAWLMTLGSLGLVAVFALIVRRQPALFTACMGLGALTWLVGNGLWLAGWPMYRVVLWWIAFLILTIAGERLELARVLRPTRASLAGFLAVNVLFLGGIMLSAIDLGTGTRLTGVGMLGLALWLLHQDIARRTIRKSGLTRFIAACLLSGYIWLAAAGVMGLIFGFVAPGPRYDALLHAIFLGFVFSMIFGHAPIIIPAVLGVRLVFDPTYYIPLILLHLSLLLRVTGDLAGWFFGRQWGGLFNAVALLLFMINTARVLRKSAKS